MLKRKELFEIETINRRPERESQLSLNEMKRDGASNINIKEKNEALPGLYELEENGTTFAIRLEMLECINKFFQLSLKNKNNCSPTLMLWYKSLSRDEKKTVMIICKERTEK